MGNLQTRVEITDPETGEVHGLNVGMLVSDIRDVLISKRRNQIATTTWDRLSEDDQRDEIVNATELAEDLVVKACELIAQVGREVIHAQLDNFKVKDGKVTLTASGIADDGALLALNHVGKKLLKIVVADAEKFDQQREELHPTPDQPDMDLEGEHVENSEEDLAQPEPMDEFEDDDFDQDQSDGGTDPGDADPFEMGEAARAEGALMKNNPFEKGSADFDAWKAGWKAGASEGADTQSEAESTEGNVGDNPGVMGRLARLQGSGPDENPFDGGTEDHDAWASAWASTDKDVKDLEADAEQAFANGKARDENPWKEGSEAAAFWDAAWVRAHDAAQEGQDDATKEGAAPEEVQHDDGGEADDGDGSVDQETPEPTVANEPEAATTEPAQEEPVNPNAVDSDAAGRAAFAEGKGLDANPFSTETDRVKHRIWKRGWESAKADSETAVDETA